MPIWIGFALLSAVSAALVAIFGKIGVSNVDTTIATTVRAIIMALFLLATSLLLGKIKLISTINNTAIFYIILSGVAGAISWLFYFFALKNGPPPGVAALDRLSVVFVLIFSVLFLADKLTLRSGIGAALITFGAVLMTLN